MWPVAFAPRLFIIFLTIPTVSVLPLLYPDPIDRPTVIPAFPEQSNPDDDDHDHAACSLHLPDQLFTSLNSVCGHASPDFTYSRCCPVLATWLYYAYSATALSHATTLASSTPASYSSSLPLLPDDSEACVDDLQKAMTARGIRLAAPNQTCDLIYCYCGIRLRPTRCPEAFPADPEGRFVGGEKVKKLERDCLGLAGANSGCSKCLHTLNQLNVVAGEKVSNSSWRSKKMHHSDCQIMGVTWLLAKNQSAYIHTVSGVLRSIMTNTKQDDDPAESCTLGNDGMPLAVDSNQISIATAPKLAHQLMNPAMLVWLCCLLVGLWPSPM